MITVSEWFKIYAKKPLFLLGIMALCIQTIFIYHHISSNETERTERIRNLVDKIANTAIEQKNRDILDAAFAVAVEELGAKYILLCKNDEAFVSYPYSHQECTSPLKTSFFLSRIEMKASGYSDYRFIFYIPKWNVSSRFIWLVVISSTILLFFFFVVMRIQNRLYRDILSPIENEFFLEQDMKISEFEELKTKVSKAQRTEKEKAKSIAKKEIEEKFAHNIQSPLGNIKILRKRLKEQLDAKSANLFDSVVQEISEMTLNFTKKTAAIAKVEDVDRIQESRALVEVESLIETSVHAKSLELSERANRVKITFENEFDSEVYVEASKVELRSILSNMINNSVDSEASKIDVKMSRSSDNYLSITISDNGNGVDESIKGSLFEKSITFGKEKGTGFGLYHAKKFINKWGGSIALDQTSNKGSLFKILLPLYTLPTLKIPSHSQIVILDDKKNEREKIKKVLIDSSQRSAIKPIIEFDEATEALNWFEIIEFDEATEALNWFETTDTPIADVLFFADNDLGDDSLNGLSLINDLGINEISFLVTSGYSSPDVFDKCKESKVALIPKNYVQNLEVVFS